MGIVVDIELVIDGWNVSSLDEVEEFVNDLNIKLDTIYPILYHVRSYE